MKHAYATGTKQSHRHKAAYFVFMFGCLRLRETNIESNVDARKYCVLLNSYY